MLNFAIETAREAGQILLEKFGRKININKKGEIDLVTEADLAWEKLIVEKIKSHYPKHSILAEESGEAVREGENTWKWIIDPLDGTTNYAHGYPCFCVTIALEHQGEIVLGVTFDPTRDEVFAAEKGRGATLNNKPIFVTQTDELKESLLVTGFPYDIALRESNFISNFSEMLFKSRAVRRDGSAAIDLAYIACGRFDGFWEEGLNPWDVAAGVLLVTEAGGRVSYYDGTEFSIYDPPICASNGFIHEEMLRVLN
jgi:myo-inositol-1(or 4)-monophosphatase